MCTVTGMHQSRMWLKLFVFGAVCLLGSAALETGSVLFAQNDTSAMPPARPRLTVKDWYFEKDGKPLYLGGLSIGADFEASSQGVFSERLTKVAGKANCIRSWLELWRREGSSCPFKLVGNKADLSQFNPEFFDKLKHMLDVSASAGIVQELTLLNPWGARYQWDNHWWNPVNNIQAHPVDEHSLYTLGNPYQALQQRWVDRVLETVAASLASDFVIIEIDNELSTGGGTWRKHFVDYIKAKGNYPVSTIADYCGDFDALNEGNDVINRHKGGINDPRNYYNKIIAYDHAKPVVFNELYVWWHNPREVQRTVLWAIFMAQGMFCVDHWGGGRTNEEETLQDVSVLVEFANSIPFDRFVRDDTWIISCPGDKWAQRCEERQAYLAYMWGRDQGPFKVSLPQGSYRVEWTDPATGKRFHQRRHVAVDGEKALDVPDYNHDLVLYIAREG